MADWVLRWLPLIDRQLPTHAARAGLQILVHGIGAWLHIAHTVRPTRSPRSPAAFSVRKHAPHPQFGCGQVVVPRINLDAHQRKQTIKRWQNLLQFHVQTNSMS
jgi:hypothetical protein